MVTTPLNIPPTLEFKIQLTDEQFWQLCQDNSEWRFERTATGELIIMPPTGGTTGNRNADLTYQLTAWNRQHNLGKSFDSNTGFSLPQGGVSEAWATPIRSPDASWIRLDRWNALTPQQQERFVPLCPDFVVELLSPSDSLEKTRAKMQEYRDNGALLGWLINRKLRQVEIYRLNQEVEILDNPNTVSGEEILPGFILDLTTIW